MDIFSGFEKIVRSNYPLAKHTWYGLGGPADYFITPENSEQLKQVVRRCNENKIAIRVMGFGSNLLVNDGGLRGAVIKFDSEEFRQTQFKGEQVTAGAGADMSKLLFACVKKGLSGLEGLTGIPGSVGGMIRMNAGGNFGDVGTAAVTVTLMDSSGKIFEKSKPELMFDYRRTNITAKFILGATLQLASAEPEQVLRTVKEIWIYKKNSQPLNTKTCGCIFKNPRGVSAGALIDRAGLKGLQIGQAVVSEKHANFIIAKNGCTSRDVRRLIELIQQKVKEQFGIGLEPEIEIWD